MEISKSTLDAVNLIAALLGIIVAIVQLAKIVRRWVSARKRRLSGTDYAEKLLLDYFRESNKPSLVSFDSDRLADPESFESRLKNAVSRVPWDARERALAGSTWQLSLSVVRSVVLSLLLLLFTIVALSYEPEDGDSVLLGIAVVLPLTTIATAFGVREALALLRFRFVLLRMGITFERRLVLQGSSPSPAKRLARFGWKPHFRPEQNLSRLFVYVFFITSALHALWTGSIARILFGEGDSVWYRMGNELAPYLAIALCLWLFGLIVEFVLFLVRTTGR
jgi:hypothetical protein